MGINGTEDVATLWDQLMLVLLSNVALDSTNRFSKTFTATATNGSTSLTSITSTQGIQLGAVITGSNIPSGTYVTALTSTTLTLSAAATGSGTGTCKAALYLYDWTEQAYSYNTGGAYTPNGARSGTYATEPAIEANNALINVPTYAWGRFRSCPNGEHVFEIIAPINNNTNFNGPVVLSGPLTVKHGPITFGGPNTHLGPFDIWMAVGFLWGCVTWGGPQPTKPNTPTFTPTGSGGSIPPGVYYGYVTTVGPTGVESAPSAEVGPFTVTGTQRVAVTNAPQCINEAVTWNLYLSPTGGGSGSETLQVTGLTGTSYTFAGPLVTGTLAQTARFIGTTPAAPPAPTISTGAITGLAAGTYWLKLSANQITGYAGGDPRFPITTEVGCTDKQQFTVATGQAIAVTANFANMAAGLGPLGIASVNIYISTDAQGTDGTYKLVLSNCSTVPVYVTSTGTGGNGPPLNNGTFSGFTASYFFTLQAHTFSSLLSSGSYYAYVTVTDALGNESLPCAEQGPISITTAQRLSIASTPTGGGITQWNLYVTNTGGAAGTETYQASFPDSGGSTVGWPDIAPDQMALSFGPTRQPSQTPSQPYTCLVLPYCFGVPSWSDTVGSTVLQRGFDYPVLWHQWRAPTGSQWAPIFQPSTLRTCRTTYNGTLTGVPVGMLPGDRVFVPQNSSGVYAQWIVQTGIWIVQEGAWIRPPDYATGTVYDAGMWVITEDHDIYMAHGILQTFPDGSVVLAHSPFKVDTDLIQWEQVVFAERVRLNTVEGTRTKHLIDLTYNPPILTLNPGTNIQISPQPATYGGQSTANLTATISTVQNPSYTSITLTPQTSAPPPSAGQIWIDNNYILYIVNNTGTTTPVNSGTAFSQVNVSDTSTDNYVVILDLTSATGVAAQLTIKNTSSTSSFTLDCQIIVTDIWGNTETQNHLNIPNTSGFLAQLINLAGTGFNTAIYPYAEIKVQVKSHTVGHPQTYTLKGQYLK